MSSGVLPAALLCVALGLGLASAEAKAAALGSAALLVTAGAVALTPVPSSWSRPVFLGCWVGIVASAAMVHSRRTLNGKVALVLSLSAGVWTGAVIALAPSKMGLLGALPLSLCVWPASWARRRGQAIVLKVLGSWLIAVAVLAATLQFLPVAPGYLSDHVD
jgi:hypothetical protein